MANLYSLYPGLEIKELSDELIVRGYVATTHYDGQDRITRSALDKWAKEINEGNPRANKVSVHHNRVPHVAGVGVKGTARVERLPDGEYGLYVETKVDKTRDDYEEIAYRVKEGFLDSFSIEYIAPEHAPMQGNVRILDDRTELMGWTLASQPMNEMAVMIKERMLKCKEGLLMTEQEQKEVKQEQEESLVVAEQKEVVTEVKQEEQPSQEQKEEVTVKEEEEDVNEEETDEKGDDSKKKKYKEESKEEIKPSVDVKELTKQVMETKEFQEALSQKVEQKVMINENKESETMETIEYKEYKQIVENPKGISVKEQFARVGRLLNAQEVSFKQIKEALSVSAEERMATGVAFKHFGTNGTKIECKGLGIGTNVNADSDYAGLSAAELQDIFDPVIYNALNEEVGLWNRLAKDDFSRKGNNEAQFVLKIGGNTATQWYDNNQVTLGNAIRQKYKTRFKKIQAGFAIDGDMIAAARGGLINDVVSQEIADASETMASVINQSLFGTTGAETDKEIIGLPYITRSATYTTLYNVTRSAANKLAPDAAGDTYIDGTGGVSKALLRQMIRHCLIDGSRAGNLLFVAHPVQIDKVKALYDNAQSYDPNAARFGFTGEVSFEGVSFLPDKDAPTTSIFLIDLSHHRVAMWVPPTVEMLGKRNDSEEGFVKSYLCTYNTAPRRMVELHSLPTA